MPICAKQLKKVPAISLSSQPKWSTATALPRQTRSRELISDMATKYRKHEKLLIRDRQRDVLASMPQVSGDEKKLFHQLEILQPRLQNSSTTQSLSLLYEKRKLFQNLSTDGRRRLLTHPAFAVVGHAEQNKTKLGAVALYHALVVLFSGCSGIPDIGPAASSLLTQLQENLFELPPENLSMLLQILSQQPGLDKHLFSDSIASASASASASNIVGVSGSSSTAVKCSYLDALLAQAEQRLPHDFKESDVLSTITTLADLPHRLFVKIDGGRVDRLFGALVDQWPRLSVDGLAKVFYQMGRSRVVREDVFYEVCDQLLYRFKFLTVEMKDNLILAMRMHKTAFDRHQVIPHPVYEDTPKRLCKLLGIDFVKRLPQLQLAESCRPLLATLGLPLQPERKVVAKLIEDKIRGGQLRFAAPGEFTHVVHVHRRLRSHWEMVDETLVSPVSVAFAIHMSKMDVRQLMISIHALTQFPRYSTKVRKIFEHGFNLLANQVEENARQIMAG